LPIFYNFIDGSNSGMVKRRGFIFDQVRADNIEFHHNIIVDNHAEVEASEEQTF
jgi:hypothetical protein